MQIVVVQYGGGTGGNGGRQRSCPELPQSGRSPKLYLCSYVALGRTELHPRAAPWPGTHADLQSYGWDANVGKEKTNNLPKGPDRSGSALCRRSVTIAPLDQLRTP